MDPDLEEIANSIANWKLIQYIAPILASATVGVAIWAFAHQKVTKLEGRKRTIEQNAVKLKQQQSALSGKLSSKIVEGRNAVTIHFGRSHISASIQALREGMSMQPFSFIGDRNITIRLKDESILVSAEFRSLDGKIVAGIVDNEWQINPNNYFDRNYDSNGLEIIDQDGITKFQIDFTDLYNIRIGGSFISNGSMYAFLPGGQSIVLGLDGQSKDQLIGLGSRIETLFTYPSQSHFGQRRRAPSVIFSPDVRIQFYNPHALTRIFPTDTMNIHFIRFMAVFANEGKASATLKLKQFQVYFDEKLQQESIVSPEFTLQPGDRSEWQSPNIYFNDNNTRIKFSEAKRIKYKIRIFGESTSQIDSNKRAFCFSYEAILHEDGTEFLNIALQ